MLNHQRVFDRTRSSHVIEYGRRFKLSASPQVVWSVLEDVDYFGTCSHWLESLTVDDPGLRAGAVVRGTITTPLPFQVRIRLKLEEWVPCRSIVAAVHGDLEGKARVALDADDERTDVNLSWTVEMTSPPMRVMARVAHPLLRRGHDLVVQAAMDKLAARACAI